MHCHRNSASRVEESASRFVGIGEKESKTLDRLMAILPRSSCANGLPMRNQRFVVLLAALAALTLCPAGAALADDLRMTKSATRTVSAFSARRLARMTSWFEAQSEKGDPSGFVVGIARGGKLAYLQATGFEDHDKKMPMRPDLDLSHRIDVQADHQRRHHDAGR